MKYEIIYKESVGFMVEKCIRYTNDYDRFLTSVKELHDSITSITVDKEVIYERGVA